MNILGKVTVLPKLPAAIGRLSELAYNLYWSWEPRACSLYRDLNPDIWETYGHNPVRTLLEVGSEDMDRAATDPEFVRRYGEVMAEFDAYMGKQDTWASRHAADLKPVAYFSMEYALHESLPIYSGGLGVLAGDHCKSASDLGLPFTPVGLLFHDGYFRQTLGRDGWQEEKYDRLDLTTLPIRPIRTPEHDELRISLEIGGRTVTARVWQLNVGRIRMLLLDTDVPENHPDDRLLTSRLYGGDQEMRLKQYMLLGIGGVRALRAAGAPAEVWHMNEGHAGLLNLERIRERVEQGLDFRTAHELTAGSTLFTTHTPVPAGNDAFSWDLMDRYLGSWPAQLHTTREHLYSLARSEAMEDHGPAFNMTVFSLRMSRMANGVSKLHGQVSRDMWKHLYPGLYPEEVPIGHVTNGAHNLSFTSQRMRDLLSTVMPEDWTERLHEPEIWQNVEQLSGAQLAGVQREMKAEMIAFVRHHQREMLLRNGAGAAELAYTDTLLSPDVLTIGFARRFATYKRATLLLRDRERLSRIVNHPERPVQFVFAGKAHPADNPGKALIQEIYRVSQLPEFRGKIVILENYDMHVARRLVQGVDVWMNNPRRPLEASGTSGMKASFNGSPNFSVLDGWWVEGHLEGNANGWPIGEEREYADQAVQDDADAFSLYQTLEQTIVPLYYGERGGEADSWAGVVRSAIESVSARFSMQRQVIDYVQCYYLPLSARRNLLVPGGGQRARELAEWKAWIANQWPQVSVAASHHLPATAEPGEQVQITAQVNPGRIAAEELRAEVVLRRGHRVERVPMQRREDGEYAATVALERSGMYEVGVRLYPYLPDLSHDFELGLVKWA
ncbi:alpha-glucan phosphorylase [Deinococcus proteolyticus MRP]|uniref:Alpha-glucan phosphorylase n=1 Tax=Deinococcus proteolyticus (strain ATCC 35074 / DSM 20540 / JCM 6276 / NBRC 101906 / NCIMB 13154 / VKM Ac-1939 / CCM 2703 / MRP) TaxID=693977 RepID=F0RMH0_DEIPM|nr:MULTISPECIES: alpha-glucan family phosphorylase [Deinococcus]ADY26020.1 alpha-glucan phosphorylase [Deinococcus proteolyticus MRP]MCY1702141.1 alpha-glucan family phosphorylase [Deinococcus sp. SL84]